MADIADDAQATAALFDGAALAAYRARRAGAAGIRRIGDPPRATLADARPAGPGSAECTVCGEPIPAARRAAVEGVDTCTSCQEDIERLSRRVG